jgi:hypothetical protein
MTGFRLVLPPALRPASAPSLAAMGPAVLALSIVAGFSLCCGEAKALVVVTSRAALNSTDFIDWSGDVLDTKPQSFSVNTNLSVPVGVSKALSGDFLRIDQVATWGFSPGDRLLFTDNFVDTDNKLTFDVPAGNFFAVGTQIQANANGPYTVLVSAYGPGDTSLGSFTLNGNSSVVPDTALFVGVRNSTPIAKVEYTVTAAGNLKGAYAFNRVDFSSNPPPPPVDAVPGPLPLWGVATGFALSRRLKVRLRASQRR